MIGTSGTTVKSSDFWSALSASTVAVLVRSLPLRSGEMSASTFTGILTVIVVAGWMPCPPTGSVSGWVKWTVTSFPFAVAVPAPVG